MALVLPKISWILFLNLMLIINIPAQVFAELTVDGLFKLWNIKILDEIDKIFLLDQTLLTHIQELENVGQAEDLLVFTEAVINRQKIQLKFLVRMESLFLNQI